MNSQENKQQKKRKFSKGKLIGVIAFAIPITLAALFMYEMSLKQVLIVESESENATHVIEVLEIGEPVNDGPSTIKLKAGSDHIEVGLRDKGDYLDENNAEIVWKNEKQATITLTGKAQQATIVEFDADKEEKFTVTTDGFEAENE